MSAGQPSLRWRLVLRLASLQAVLLSILAILIVAALWMTGSVISLQPEDETIDAIAQSIERANDGTLAIKVTPALKSRRAELPDLWFVVRDRAGSMVTSGKVPQVYAGIGGTLDGIGQARFGSNFGGDIVPVARLQWVGSPAGEIQVLTGVDGSVSPTRVIAARTVA